MSGDMFLGALVDAGVAVKVLEETVAALNVGARLQITRVDRSGITAAKVDVYSHGEKDLPREVYWEQRDQHEHQHEHQHDHGHDHRHEHSHGHSHEHPKAALHEHEHTHGRSLSEIKRIISGASIGERAKQNAIKIFEALGAAEAKIHNTDVEAVHFHEVGAVDAIVDIVCAAVGFEALGVDELICSPVNVGGGSVKCAHGDFPVPAPATLELLKGAPVYSSGIQAELVTPTGAAIVRTLATGFSAFPEMKIKKSGYGAGTCNFPGHANVVRMTIGEAAASLEATTSQETITVLESNLDDLNPQVVGYVMDRLLEEGALDAFCVAVQMKKNRPGALLTVLCRPQDAPRLAHLVFAETTTLGVRQREEKRRVLARRWINVATPWGEVRMKIASMNETVTTYAPEYEDCRKIAAGQHVPLKSVMDEAVKSYIQQTQGRKK
jgi:uncharacterized protein (TIGR00299 family) protein